MDHQPSPIYDGIQLRECETYFIPGSICSFYTFFFCFEIQDLKYRIWNTNNNPYYSWSHGWICENIPTIYHHNESIGSTHLGRNNRKYSSRKEAINCLFT